MLQKNHRRQVLLVNFKIDARLTKDLDDKDRKQLRHDVANSVLAEVLTKYIEITEREMETKEVSDSQYDKASWPFWSAHCNGKKTTLSFLKKLLMKDNT